MTSFEITGQFFISDSKTNSKSSGDAAKRLPDKTPANPPFGGARRSPPKFDGQLHVELLTGPKAGRSVEIAYSVVNLAETGQTRAVVKADVFCARKVHRPDTRREVYAIEDVEHVRTKLQCEPLFDGNVLDDGEIDVLEIRPDEPVSRNRRSSATTILCWAAERARINPLNARERRIETV